MGGTRVSGARLGYMINTLKKSLDGIHPHLKCVVIQVGVNHREDREVLIRQLKSLVEVIHTSGARATYVGVSYAYDMPRKYRMHIYALNEAAQGLFEIGRAHV